MLVLITRQAEDAQASAVRVRALGHEPLVAPLSRIVAQQEGLDWLATYAAQRSHQMDAQAPGIMVATSRHAIDVLLANGFQAWLSAQRWAVVGERAGELLTRSGAKLILPPADDVAQLMAWLSTSLAERQPVDRLGLYLCATDRRSELEVAFPGLQAVEVYAAQALAGFDAPQVARLADALGRDADVAALVYSPRSAKLAMAAFARAGLARQAQSVNWYCLSQQVAQSLQVANGQPHLRLHWPQEPGESALLDLLSGVV